MRCRQQAAAFGADEGADQLALRKPHGRDPDSLVGCRARGRATSPAEGWGERSGATQFRRVRLSQDSATRPLSPPPPQRHVRVSRAPARCIEPPSVRPRGKVRWAVGFSPSADLVTRPRSGRSAGRDICEVRDGHSAASLGRLVLPNEASYFDSLIFDEGSPQSKSPY